MDFLRNINHWHICEGSKGLKESYASFLTWFQICICFMHLFLIGWDGWLRTVPYPSMIPLAQMVMPRSSVFIRAVCVRVASCWGRRCSLFRDVNSNLAAVIWPHSVI